MTLLIPTKVVREAFFRSLIDAYIQVLLFSYSYLAKLLAHLKQKRLCFSIVFFHRTNGLRNVNSSACKPSCTSSASYRNIETVPICVRSGLNA
jgi:hypothetical protein